MKLFDTTGVRNALIENKIKFYGPGYNDARLTSKNFSRRIKFWLLNDDINLEDLTSSLMTIFGDRFYAVRVKTKYAGRASESTLGSQSLRRTRQFGRRADSRRVGVGLCAPWVN